MFAHLLEGFASLVIIGVAALIFFLNRDKDAATYRRRRDDPEDGGK